MGTRAQGLPGPGERVAVIGCGTSWFMAMCYAVLRESAGLGWTDAFTATELPVARAYDRVLAISRSGTTTEVLEVLATLRGRTPTVAITGDPAAPIVDTARTSGRWSRPGSRRRSWHCSGRPWARTWHG
jgi:fructoselysine-6-P-deglycase FrlB-like protein